MSLATPIDDTLRTLDVAVADALFAQVDSRTYAGHAQGRRIAVAIADGHAARLSPRRVDANITVIRKDIATRIDPVVTHETRVVRVGVAARSVKATIKECC